MALTVSPEVQEAEKRKRMRSPAYPYINLEAAIKRAQEFYNKEQRNAAPLKVAVKHWGYEEKSSGGLQTAAALISFGLMQDDGTGDKRKVRLTDTALQILLDTRPDSQQRAEAIRKAALTPKIHQQLWRKWGNSKQSDENMAHFLVLELKPPFNPAVAKTVIKEYRDTIAYAKPDESAIVPLVDGDLSAETQEETEVAKGGGRSFSQQPEHPFKVGDYVQWEPKGILQFREPKQITSVSADGSFAFVEGSSTGLPIGELALQKKPATGTAQRLPENQTMRQDVFSLTEGTVTIQWPTPLSADSIQDLKDWLAIVERKITRSVASNAEEASFPKGD